ncbi:unnamed protein product [Tilletia laevis]|uniref:Jacalin-type lectin domain-containing protein n=2 Tax=Tilletia TaxID=13289 RepID=A0A9N8Q7M5_9BASI|nr:hypothetical protein CF336_g2526 [Tilletia laevis]CAD6891727.1 unnamed protein product [Tilletia caries]KAE8206878.1 hypothetical protein CF335_g1551 [Tilletia laevis]CAD6898442.1 unnamed protein product [Tilletia laevis]CAD6916827.1 unnamed protein product [Tilletia caries]
MSLLLAPFNNAMRLGQGFNSYSQTICIDDAVVASPHRAENFLTNDGQTMRTQILAKDEPSLWRSKPEVFMDDDRIAEARAATNQLLGNFPLTSPQLDREELLRANDRKVESGGASNTGTTLPPPPPPYTDLVQASNPLEADTRTWQIKNIGGPSQTVTYSSRFVSSLSQITKDMGISASLSIKAGTVAGSGRGSFIDTDKFLDSDLNFYISCKVVNQSINFRDQLEFNPLPAGIVDDDQHLAVYGDSFVSGFLEGGEFNALVSMKVLNKSSMTQIEAAVKVAFSSGALDIKASAAFSLAKSNINLNTQTNITASWLGGGVIKPPEEPWTLESLVRAASRFPESVAHSPQRTYAILQKYDHLRSYLALEPLQLSKLNYDNVALYTEELMEYYMAYKAMLTSIPGDMREIQAGTKRFRPVAEPPRGSFSATLDGIEEAVRQIRPQMVMIVNRVEEIEKRPNIVSDTAAANYQERFASPVSFWARLPIVESIRTGQASRPPLSGRRIGPASSAVSGSDASTGDGQDTGRQAAIGALCETDPALLSLTAAEEKAILTRVASETAKSTTIQSLRLTRPVGSREDGVPFFGFNYVKAHTFIASIVVGVAQGTIANIAVSYASGLQWRRGRTDEDQELFSLKDFAEGETIITVVLEHGSPVDELTKGSVTGIKLTTSLGRTLDARASTQVRYGYQCRILDGRVFIRLEEFTFNSPLPNGSMAGFYGLSLESGNRPGIHRLGLAWSSVDASTPSESSQGLASKNLPLIGLQRVPSFLDKAFEGDLLPAEREALLNPTARLAYRGLRFGPCIATDATPSGSLFNGVDLLRGQLSVQQQGKPGTKAGTPEWPTRLVFMFSKSNGTSTLVAVRVSYGKVTFVHGATEDDHKTDGSTISLDIKLAPDERVRKIQVQAHSGAGSAMPSGIALHTDKRRVLAFDALQGGLVSAPLNGGGVREINGFEGMNGLKAFVGMESDTALTRLLSVWG